MGGRSDRREPTTGTEPVSHGRDGEVDSIRALLCSRGNSRLSIQTKDGRACAARETGAADEELSGDGYGDARCWRWNVSEEKIAGWSPAKMQAFLLPVTAIS